MVAPWTASPWKPGQRPNARIVEHRSPFGTYTGRCPLPGRDRRRSSPEVSGTGIRRPLPLSGSSPPKSVESRTHDEFTGRPIFQGSAGQWPLLQRPCRNATIARWNADENCFYHWREKFGRIYIETSSTPRCRRDRGGTFLMSWMNCRGCSSRFRLMQRRLSPGTGMTSMSTPKRCAQAASSVRKATMQRKALAGRPWLNTELRTLRQARKGRGGLSGGCRHFIKLLATWGTTGGVCSNPESPRAGLLTFEHQGCTHSSRSLERGKHVAGKRP